MRPSKHDNSIEQNIFSPLLMDILAPNHALVRLSHEINWDNLDQSFGTFFSQDKGRPGIPTRLMVSLHYLKYLENLSDEAVLHRWVENPYWQFFSGFDIFQYSLPIDSSSMTNWRKRLKGEGANHLLDETIAAGLKMKVIKTSHLKNVNIDTTVQEKFIRFPTDARLYERCTEKLVKAAEKRDIKLRQKYPRVNKRLLYDQARFSHSRKYKEAKSCTRKLKTNLGRVLRDIRRKADNIDLSLNRLLSVCEKVHKRERKEKHKIYSAHEPEVSCISKGKAHKKYEFGNKVGISVTSKGGWILSSVSFKGNPYDGHTLLETIEGIPDDIQNKMNRVFVDRGYKGHKYEGGLKIFVDQQRRGSVSKSLWKWMKQRAKVEPTIGHLKSDHRLTRNRLKGEEGDSINAVLSAAAMNLKKLLSFFLTLLFSRTICRDYKISKKVCYSF